MKNVLLLLCFEFAITNTRTSTLWRLNSDQTKIVDGTVEGASMEPKTQQYETVSDTVFGIIASTIHFEGDLWMKQHVEDCSACTDCSLNPNMTHLMKTRYGHSDLDIVQPAELDCGKSVNFTYYDNLVGISNRHRHPKISERQAAHTFSKYRKLNMKGDFDIDSLEKKLKKAKKEKPKSVTLYNQIGNFWHFKGETQKSIECFRHALSMSPHAAEVLLNLARVLFTLQYLDDAIYLTRRSLEVQPPDKGAWQQYFTLGEIFKTYGHYQDAAVHLRHTLELKPDFEPALLALKEMEALPADAVHVYTLVIIVCLVLGVLLVILTNVEPLAIEADAHHVKVQRHFNKAMAMKTLRGFGIKNSRRIK